MFRIIMNIFYFNILLYLFSCSTINHNLWLNKFEVCCVIETEVYRDGKKIDFRDGYFIDKYVKLVFNYDLFSGIKLDIWSECMYISEINWNNATYIDEYGAIKKLIIYDNIPSSKNNIEKNISMVIPYNNFSVTLIPSEYVYKEKEIWHFRQMFDPNLKPDNLKGRKVSLNFSFPCDENIYNYLVYFNINSRY
ncbi:MAG: hypothetical protein N2Z20_04830 [Elusimicrobiales bacterium]|nr:hypothetical protein [Elusimicrobiales bacterium]